MTLDDNQFEELLRRLLAEDPDVLLPADLSRALFDLATDLAAAFNTTQTNALTTLHAALEAESRRP